MNGRDNAKLEQRRLKSYYIRIKTEISETYGFQNRTALDVCLKAFDMRVELILIDIRNAA